MDKLSSKMIFIKNRVYNKLLNNFQHIENTVKKLHLYFGEKILTK